MLHSDSSHLLRPSEFQVVSVAPFSALLPFLLPFSLQFTHFQMFQCTDHSEMFVRLAGNFLSYSYSTCNFKKRDQGHLSWLYTTDIRTIHSDWLFYIISCYVPGTVLKFYNQKSIKRHMIYIFYVRMWRLTSLIYIRVIEYFCEEVLFMLEPEK